MKLHLESQFPQTTQDFKKLYENDGYKVEVVQQWGEWTYSPHFHSIVDIDCDETNKPVRWWNFAGWLHIDELNLSQNIL